MFAESRVGRIGPITLGVKQTGERRAGNPHAAFEVAEAGNVAWSRCCDTRRRKGEQQENTNFDLNRRASLRPYRENLCSVAPTARREKSQAAPTARARVPMRSAGAEQPGVVWKARPVMGPERRGCVVRPWPLANWKQEELVDKAKPFKIPKREVWEAFKRVKANQGAAGVDGQSIAEAVRRVCPAHSSVHATARRRLFRAAVSSTKLHEGLTRS
jgi:hypothetical protein